MLRKSIVVLVAFFSIVGTSAAQTADSRFLGTRWDKPGPQDAALSPPLGGKFGPGEADWSIMSGGIGIAGGDVHPGPSFNFDSLLPMEPAGTAAALFETALQLWEVASPTPGQPGSGFTLLPEAADGAGMVGQAGPNPPDIVGDGRVGDIRAGVFPFADITPSLPSFDVIAHAYRPDTAQQALFHGMFSSIGGDAHFRPHESIVQNGTGVNWINWQPGDPMPAFGEVDLLTVMIHEVGHALGLGHNMIPDPDNVGSFIPADPNSVMVPIYPGVRQSLSATDVANIRLLYSIPEPHSAGLVMIGLLFASGAQRRSRVAVN